LAGGQKLQRVQAAGSRAALLPHKVGSSYFLREMKRMTGEAVHKNLNRLILITTYKSFKAKRGEVVS
jgi:hypothetical protein